MQRGQPSARAIARALAVVAPPFGPVILWMLIHNTSETGHALKPMAQDPSGTPNPGLSQNAPTEVAERRVVKIPASLGRFRAATTLISHIIYPGIGPQAEQDRLNAERAIGFEAFKRGGNLPASDVLIPRHYVSLSDAERQRILRKANTQLGKRLAAARIAMPFLWQLAFNQELILAEGGQAVPLTIKNLSEKYHADAGEADTTNVQGRAFRPSFPVLHMAIALELLLSYCRRILGCRLSIYDLPLRSRFMEGMMLGGKEVEKLIALAPELQGAARQLIRFELA
jgi:hypothetical protein